MKNELDVLASEFPVLSEKGSYKYLNEVAGKGEYFQVSWQKLEDEFVALYGKQEIPIISLNNDILFEEEV